MRFIADVMLGRLAKRLRLLGFDVLYDRTFDDNEIIRLSLEQDRVILTRDNALSERPLAVNHLFIQDDGVRQQLHQVLTSFALTGMSRPLTRCSECNEPLTMISRDDARDRVPRYVYERYRGFFQCEQCGRIYWRGTHLERMGLTGRS